MDSEEEMYMARALALAERGRGHVEPNPLVGAVLVRDGQVVGEGYHQRYGEAHAEVNALRQAGERAGSATLYVTLEPCCHFGKTPPCVEALIEAGIGRVVAAMIDPAKHASGRGLQRLQAAGIQVDCGLLEQQARLLNAPYLKLTLTGRPYVHAKWAMSLDGKIATVTGESKWITGESARTWAHQLRGRVDAIAVGVGTVLADDPLLTARPPGPRTAVRLVVDEAGMMPLDCQLARTARSAPVLVATTERSEPQWRQRLIELGCELLVLDPDPAGVSIAALLAELGRRQMTNLLVEGGSRLLGSFLAADEIDEVHAFVGTKLLGGESARTPIAGPGVASVADSVRLSQLTVTYLGSDLLIHGRVQRPWLDGGWPANVTT